MKFSPRTFNVFDQRDQLVYCRACDRFCFGRDAKCEADSIVECVICGAPVEHADYAGGQICVGSARRAIELGERVTLVDGRAAVVIGCTEGNHVFEYQVAVISDQFSVGTAELTPMENP